MATRKLTMVVDRKHAEEYKEGFAANPSNFTDNSYVNMYLHHDGYPEWQGILIANWLHANPSSDGSRLAATLVHDMYYDICYLNPTPESIDHHYTYVIWSGKKDRWVSCWDNYSSYNVFVLKPEKIISKYMDEMEYTDFANGKTRYHENNESNLVNLSHADATTIMDILKNSIK